MKRLVKLRQGWLELDIRTFRHLPRFLRRRALPGEYSVVATRYGSDGWSVGDPEEPQEGWRSGTGSSLGAFLTEFAGIEPSEAESIASETITEWKRRDPYPETR